MGKTTKKDDEPKKGRGGGVGKKTHKQPKLKYRGPINSLCKARQVPTPDADAHQVLQLALDYVFEQIMDHCTTRIQPKAKFTHYIAQNGAAAYLTSCGASAKIMSGSNKYVDGLLKKLQPQGESQ